MKSVTEAFWVLNAARSLARRLSWNLAQDCLELGKGLTIWGQVMLKTHQQE